MTFSNEKGGHGPLQGTGGDVFLFLSRCRPVACALRCVRLDRRHLAGSWAGSSRSVQVMHRQTEDKRSRRSTSACRPAPVKARMKPTPGRDLIKGLAPVVCGEKCVPSCAPFCYEPHSTRLVPRDTLNTSVHTVRDGRD